MFSVPAAFPSSLGGTAFSPAAVTLGSAIYMPTPATMTELLDRARAGDGEAFAQLTAPYRGELTLAGERICGITRFDNSALPHFGLPVP